jgi:hypothetical protein
MAEYNGECGHGGGKCVRAGGGDSGGGGKQPTTLITNLDPKLDPQINLARQHSSMPAAARTHDDPERRALAQPRHDVAVHVRGSGTSRLTHHAGAHDESHVWVEEVR